MVEITCETMQQIVRSFGARGVRQGELAKQLGMSANHLANLCSRRRPITQRTRDRVRALLVETALRDLESLPPGAGCWQPSPPMDARHVNESEAVSTRAELLRRLDRGELTHEDVRRAVLYFRSRGVMRTTLAKKMGISYTYLTAVFYRSKPVTGVLCDRLRSALKGRLPRIDRLKTVTSKMAPAVQTPALPYEELLALLDQPVFTAAELRPIVAYFQKHGISRTKLAARLGIGYFYLSSLMLSRAPISELFRERCRRALAAPLAEAEPEQPPNVPCVRLPSVDDGTIPEPSGPTLDAHLQVYVLERPIAKSSADRMRETIRFFGNWLRRPATMGDLNDKLVNRWLNALNDAGKSKIYQKGMRTRLLCLWRHAFQAELVDQPPLRVRRIKVERRIPEAWSREQISRLLVAAVAERGRFRFTTVRCADYWEAFIRAGYDTGLRLSDLMNLRKGQIGDDGTFTVVQHKTGDGIVCRFSPETLAAIERTGPGGREFIFGGILTYNYFARCFRRIVKRAGLRGTSKWLRRSGATAIEAAYPGAATAFLGHRTADLAMRHYVDRTQIQRMKPCPPPLPPLGSPVMDKK